MKTSNKRLTPNAQSEKQATERTVSREVNDIERKEERGQKLGTEKRNENKKNAGDQEGNEKVKVARNLIKVLVPTKDEEKGKNYVIKRIEENKTQTQSECAGNNVEYAQATPYLL